MNTNSTIVRRAPRRAPAALLALVVLAGCGDSSTGPKDGVEPITELPRQLTGPELAVIDASNRFTFDLLRQASRPDSNLFLSPLSASMALGMLLNGAAGETWDQTRATLGFGDLAQDDINDSYQGLIELLLGLDPTVEMAVGNSVWSRLGFPLRPDFVDAVTEHFGAEAAELDFSAPGASDRINGWVEDATRGRIQDIVPDPIPPWVVAYLINAIYFKGTWTYEFDPADTHTEPFHLRNGSTASVQLMTLEGGLPYRTDDRFQAVDLPYGGGAFSMTVLLPREGWSVDDVLASLDADGWTALTDGLQEANGVLFLPRFRLAYRRMLNDDLQALGMMDAFDPNVADLSRLSDVAGLYVSSVLQKSWVEVNEEGTEAAAATSVEVGLTSVGGGGFEMRVDRPFLFVIRERLSGTILFAGQIVEPPAA